MIRVERYCDGRFFSLEDNYESNKFKMFDFDGTQRTVKKSCSLCRFAELTDNEEFFVCTINDMTLNELIMKDSRCVQFDVSDLILQDLFTRCQ